MTTGANILDVMGATAGALALLDRLAENPKKRRVTSGYTRRAIYGYPERSEATETLRGAAIPVPGGSAAISVQHNKRAKRVLYAIQYAGKTFWAWGAEDFLTESKENPKGRKVAARKFTAKQRAAQKLFAQRAKAGTLKRGTRKNPTRRPVVPLRRFEVVHWRREKNTAAGNPVFGFVLRGEKGDLYTGKTKPNADFVTRGIAGKVRSGDVIEGRLSFTPAGRYYLSALEMPASNPRKRASRRPAVRRSKRNPGRVLVDRKPRGVELDYWRVETSAGRLVGQFVTRAHAIDFARKLADASGKQIRVVKA